MARVFKIDLNNTQAQVKKIGPGCFKITFPEEEGDSKKDDSDNKKSESSRPSHDVKLTNFF